MKKIFIYIVCVLLASCDNSDKKPAEAARPQGPLAQSVNSDDFNQSFGKLLADYYQLKDNFVAEKKDAILQAANAMLVSTDSLPLTELKADSNLVATARSYTFGIAAELKGLIGEKDILQQRKSFQLISDQLYDLIRTVQYDRAVVYHAYCPMAFDDQGANWLSSESGIRNPYIPRKMLTCGEIKDSIDFRPNN